MKRSASAVRIGAELVPVLLILGSLAGSLALLIAAYQRQAAILRDQAAAVVEIPPKRPQPPKPRPVPKPAPPPAPEPPEDPTVKIVASIDAQAAAERAEAAQADAKTAALETARQKAEGEAARWKQREQLVRDRAHRLDDLARNLEIEADALTRVRDVLARRRDEERADLAQAQARARDAFAILPYRGENGTWRRPIALECRNGQVKIQPDGPIFSMLDLNAGGFRSRSSPITAAVNRAFARVHHDVAPDGSAVVPYILFLIRPDGIRPYYEARAQLERLGIAFGYELIEQDVSLDFPDLDDPSEWPGAPTRPRAPAWPAPPSTLAGSRPGAEGQLGAEGRPGVVGNNPYVWHAEEPPPAFPSAGPGGGLSFSDLERGLSGGRRDGAESDRPGFVVDGLDLSGPPIAYEPDPRRPSTGTMTGGGIGTDPRRSGNASRSQTGLGGTGGSSGLGRPATRGGLGLPGDGPGLGPLGGDRRGDRNESPGQPGAGSSSQPGALTGLPPGRSEREREGVPSLSETQGGTEPTTTAAARDLGGDGSEGLAPARPGSGPAGSTASRPAGSPGLASDEPPVLPFSLSPPGGTVASVAGRGASATTAGASAAGGLPGGSRPTGSAGQGTGAPSLGGSGSNPIGGLGFGLPLPPSSTSSSGAPGASGLLSLGTLSDTSAPSDQPGPRPLSLVIDCRADGVTIQPGGYRLSRQALENSDLLVRRLQAIVQADPVARGPEAPTPWLNFLVQPGGQETFWMSRRQTTFAGLNWPARLRVAESGGLESFTGRLR